MMRNTERIETGGSKDESGSLLRRFGAVTLSVVLAGTVAMLPADAAGAATNATKDVAHEIEISGGSFQGRFMKLTSSDEGVRRVLLVQEVDRAQVENLQRWVTSGHDEWCKDARQVAAEEMRRLATDFTEGGSALIVADEGTGRTEDGTSATTFEWTAPDGSARYRVTVEKFAWLLPIAGDAESIVWVPTGAEIWICEGSANLGQIQRAGGASPPVRLLEPETQSTRANIWASTNV